MKPGEQQAPLVVALQDLHQQLATLAGDDSLFLALSAQQRRDAHAQGSRLQDRLMGILASLVDGMAEDGADLVGEDGLPLSYKEGGKEA